MATLPNSDIKFWIFAFSLILVFMQSHCKLNTYEQCVREIGIPKDSNATQIILNVNDPKFNCIDTCVLKKIGMIKNGKINAEITFNILKRTYRGSLSNLRTKTDTCATKANKVSNECEAGNVMRKCLAKES